MSQSTNTFLKLIRNLEQPNRNNCLGVFLIHLGRILSRFEFIFEFLKLRKIQEINVDQVHHDELRKDGYVGYANYYLFKCWNNMERTFFPPFITSSDNKSELKNKADVTIYKQLLEIDSKLGTTQSEQLLRCFDYSLRKDLIEVIINF